MVEDKYCFSCGGTGEAYIGALAGDGWRGRDCSVCNGYGGYVIIDGEHYTHEWTKGPVLRGPDGRFHSYPTQLELDADA